MSKPAHAVIHCRLPEIEASLDTMADEFDLIACSTCQMGTGFGAFVQATLIFKRKPQVGRPPKLEKNIGAGIDRVAATNGAH